MPDWLINLVVQYPIAVLNGLVAWYAWKQVRVRETDVQKLADEREKRQEARLDEMRREFRSAADTEIKRSSDVLKEANAAHLASKDAEIERVAKQFTDELKKLAKKIDELGKK